MPDAKRRAERREQQAREIEDNQAQLRSCIAETRRLVDESDAILERHRRERDADDEMMSGANGAAPERTPFKPMLPEAD